MTARRSSACSRTAAPSIAAPNNSVTMAGAMLFMRCAFSAADEDRFQVFARNHHGVIARAVEAVDQGEQIVLQPLSLRSLQRREGLEGRSVQRPERVEPMRRRTIAK